MPYRRADVILRFRTGLLVFLGVAGLWLLIASVIGLALTLPSLSVWKSAWEVHLLFSGGILLIPLFTVGCVLDSFLSHLWDTAKLSLLQRRREEVYSRVLLMTYRLNPTIFAEELARMSEEDRLHEIDRAQANSQLAFTDRDELLRALGSEPGQQTGRYRRQWQQRTQPLSFREVTQMIRARPPVSLLDENDE